MMERPAEHKGEEDLDAEAEEAEAKAGYSAAYNALRQAARKETDPVPDVTDPKVNLARALAGALAQQPGRIGSIVSGQCAPECAAGDRGILRSGWGWPSSDGGVAAGCLKRRSVYFFQWNARVLTRESVPSSHPASGPSSCTPVSRPGTEEPLAVRTPPRYVPTLPARPPRRAKPSRHKYPSPRHVTKIPQPNPSDSAPDISLFPRERVVATRRKRVFTSSDAEQEFTEHPYHPGPNPRSHSIT